MHKPSTLIYAILALSITWAVLVKASIIGVRKHEVSATAALVDQEPPSAPVVEVTSITRGKGPVQLPGGITQISSMDDIGIVVVRVLSLIDNHSEPGTMGLRFVAQGNASDLSEQLVPNFDLWPADPRDVGRVTVWLTWIDGRTEIQEPIYEQLLVYAVDHAGNVSALADTLVISDPGRP